MEFLKQLLGDSSNPIHTTSDAMLEDFSGLDATNLSTFLSEADKISKRDASKPRNKPLNDALLSKKSGAMPAKNDYARAKDKREVRSRMKELDEASSGAKRFQYTAFDTNGKYIEAGYVQAADAVDARKQASLKVRDPRARVEVKDLPVVK